MRRRSAGSKNASEAINCTSHNDIMRRIMRRPGKYTFIKTHWPGEPPNIMRQARQLLKGFPLFLIGPRSCEAATPKFPAQMCESGLGSEMHQVINLL